MGPMSHHRTKLPRFVGKESPESRRKNAAWVLAGIVAAMIGGVAAADGGVSAAISRGLADGNALTRQHLVDDRELWDWEIALGRDLDGDGWIGAPPPPPPPPIGGGGVH